MADEIRNDDPIPTAADLIKTGLDIWLEKAYLYIAECIKRWQTLLLEGFAIFVKPLDETDYRFYWPSQIQHLAQVLRDKGYNVEVISDYLQVSIAPATKSTIIMENSDDR